MSNILGHIGALCFQASAVSLMVSALRNKDVNVPWSTIILILVGASTSGLHAIGIGDLPFILNTWSTFFCWAVVAACKHAKRKCIDE